MLDALRLVRKYYLDGLINKDALTVDSRPRIPVQGRPLRHRLGHDRRPVLAVAARLPRTSPAR